MSTFFSDWTPTNPLLQSIYTKFAQSRSRFKALQLAPVVNEGVELKGRFSTQDISELLRLPDTTNAPYTPIQTVPLQFGETSYTLDQDAIGVNIDRRQPPKMAPERWPQSSMEKIDNILRLRLEKRAKDVFNTLTTYLSTQRTILAGATQWTNTSSPILQNCQDAIAAVTLAAEGIVQLAAPLAVWQAIQRHPAVTDMVKYVEGAKLSQLTVDAMAAALGFDRGLNLDAAWDTSNPGGTAARARLWGNHAIISVIDEDPSEGTSQFATTLSASQAEDPILMDSYEVPPHQTIYYGEMATKIVITNQAAAYYFQDAA